MGLMTLIIGGLLGAALTKQPAQSKHIYINPPPEKIQYESFETYKEINCHNLKKKLEKCREESSEWRNYDNVEECKENKEKYREFCSGFEHD